jgi:hypothetical protein
VTVVPNYASFLTSSGSGACPACPWLRASRTTPAINIPRPRRIENIVAPVGVIVNVQHNCSFGQWDRTNRHQMYQKRRSENVLTPTVSKWNSIDRYDIKQGRPC